MLILRDKNTDFIFYKNHIFIIIAHKKFAYDEHSNELKQGNKNHLDQRNDRKARVAIKKAFYRGLRLQIKLRC